MIFTALAVVWVLVSVGAASFDLSPQFHAWPAIRVVIWVVQGLLALAAGCFWLFERPRQIKLDDPPEPPVIHGS